MRHVTMQLDGDRVRFTPDGKIAVVDAIRVLNAGNSPEQVWEALKQECPELKDLCQAYHFRKEGTDSVVDSEGWEMIENALLDFILDM